MTSPFVCTRPIYDVVADLKIFDGIMELMTERGLKLPWQETIALRDKMSQVYFDGPHIEHLDALRVCLNKLFQAMGG